jgi:glycosyltransferase involved in cell wall biosynthesis
MIKTGFVIIVTGKPDRLDETISSISAQAGGSAEIVCIIDEAHRESAAEIIKRSSAPVTVIHSDLASEAVGSPLNKGISLTNGEAVFLITRMVTLPPGFVSDCAEKLFSRGSIGFVYGSYIEERAENEEVFTQTGTDNYDFSESSKIGPVRAIRKEVFETVGYYDPSLGYAFDYDLRMRIFERYEIAALDGPAYRILHSGDEANNHDPALPRSSYTNYTREEEAEFKEACCASLKRRGAFLTRRPERAPEGESKDPGGPEISVVIPLYNREKYIGRTIESVLESEWKRYEIIIVDNGSTDGSFETASKYTGRGCVTVLRCEVARNTAAALNTGIRRARGKYICQLDSDDLYTPDALSIMYDYMESSPGYALGVSYYDWIGPDDSVLDEYGIVKHEEYDRNNILRTEGVGAARIWRRSVLDEMGGFDEITLGSYAEDYDLVLRVSEKYDILRIPYVLYHYRINHKETGEEADYVLRHEKKTRARKSAILRRRMISAGRKGEAAA